MKIKTGTTIVGLKYKDGLILCADTRSTNGPVVADKNCEKIHFITEKIVCCGAGIAADTRRVTRRASKALQLFSYKHLKDPYVNHAERLICDYLHSYGGNIVAALVLGGVDDNGVFLYSISPHGYSMPRDFISMGSGSMAAISVLETGYKKDMSKEEAIELGASAIKAGILNDLYSGSNVDVSVIERNGTVTRMRNYLKVESKRNTMEIKYPRDSVAILREDVFNFVEEIGSESVSL